MKTSTRQDISVQRKAQAECTKLRAILLESVSVYNEMAALLDAPTLEVREVAKAKTKRRRK